MWHINWKSGTSLQPAGPVQSTSSDMSIQHQLVTNQFSPEPMYCQSRQYLSLHHSESHGDRWNSESPTPAYSMAPTTQITWGSGGKQQSRQPPTPPMHAHLEDYHHYGPIEADYRGLSMAPVQHTPLSPPISDGFMSPYLTNQYPNQAWSHSYGARSETTNISLTASSPLLGSVLPDVSRGQARRRKRRLTEPGEANYHCQTCGKYFSRVWNYNAHRETHDPGRPKPHACTELGCEKAFVRRTDLTRHVQCVSYPLFIQGYCVHLLILNSLGPCQRQEIQMQHVQ